MPNGNSDDGTDDPTRMSIVETALLETTETVHARRSGEPDENGRVTRQGWDQLIKYFQLAAPGVWPEETIKYIDAPGLPHWCVIFALWALKEAGLNVGNWKMGSGIASVAGVKPTSKPKVGDVGFVASFQHHCIVKEILDEGDMIVSIDGNSGNDSEISINKRPRTAFHSFYTAL